MKKVSLGLVMVLGIVSVVQAEYRPDVGWHQYVGSGKSEESACEDALKQIKNDHTVLLDRGCYDCEAQHNGSFPYALNGTWACKADSIRAPKPPKNNIIFPSH